MLKHNQSVYKQLTEYAILTSLQITTLQLTYLFSKYFDFINLHSLVLNC